MIQVMQTLDLIAMRQLLSGNKALKYVTFNG